MQMIYFSPVPWASFAQRPHKFVEWLHARTDAATVWVDPYPTRLPVMSDFRRVGSREVHAGDAPPPWLEVLKARALPIEPIPYVEQMNTCYWGPLLHRLERFASVERTLVAIGKPSLLALQLLDRVPEAVSLYDAMDNFPAFYQGLSRVSMHRRERQLMQRTTKVLTSSTRLKQRWSALRDDIQLIPNGLDPAALPKISRREARQRSRILGYVGTISSWLNWPWLIALAEARPYDVVRLIGPVLAPAPAALPGNIEMLPPCGHRDALVAMQDFDVGLIPFVENDLTDFVDPIKFYEYHSLGLPVLSTRFGEMALRDGESGTFLTNGRGDLAKQIDLALRYVAPAASIAEFRSANAWTVRFDSADIL